MKYKGFIREKKFCHFQIVFLKFILIFVKKFIIIQQEILV